MESDATEAIQSLMKWLNVPSDADEQLHFISDLTELVVALSNNTRMWFLRGHTPVEMREIVVSDTVHL